MAVLGASLLGMDTASANEVIAGLDNMGGPELDAAMADYGLDPAAGEAAGVGDQYTLYMEGNFDAAGDALADAPAPGIGQGYNNAYREQHENQWNPAYPENEDHNGLMA